MMQIQTRTITKIILQFSNPFGMLMQERSYSSIAYRYGFNGMEMENEKIGSGNEYTTDYRQLDVRLGRWLSLDPENRVDLSRYSCMSNMPIIRVDPHGDDDYYNEHGQYLYTDTKTSNDIRIIPQAAWDKINLNYSKEIADKTTSYRFLLGALETNSKVCVFKTPASTLNKMWEDSHPEVPLGSTDINGNTRKEIAAWIVLDPDKAEVTFVLQDNSHNTADNHKPDCETDETESFPLNDNRIIIGEVHTHPNKEGERKPGTLDKYSTKPGGNDELMSKKGRFPVYTYGYNFQGTGMEIDRNMPGSGQNVDTYNTGTDNDKSNIGRDALEAYGSIKR